MKFILLILLLNLNLGLYSQQNNFVEYSLIINGEEKFNEYLIFNSKDSFYFGYGGIFDSYDKTDYKSLLNYFNIKKISNVRVHYNYELKKIYDYKPTIKPKGFAYEDINYINWKIINNQHNIILGYKCYRAETTFRGRKYVAWFTSDIPYSEGPWKLKGLPGLILKISDSNSKFSYEVKSLFLNSNLSVPKELVSLFFENESNSIKFEDAIIMENNFLEEKRQQSMASFPKGTFFQNPPLRSEMKETDFEWEETKKTK